jgi:hypothetical protein
VWDFEELAVLELEFYKNMNNNLQAIETRLLEIEEEYLIFPHVHFDEEQGQLYKRGRSVEDAVIWKIDAEESLFKMRERIIKRCNRVARAYNQLSEGDQNILDLVYLDDVEYTLGVKCRLLGFKEVGSFKRATRQALLNFYRFITKEKAAIRQAKRDAYKEAVKRNLQEYLDDKKNNEKRGAENVGTIKD